jgi:hypothetical protein
MSKNERPWLGGAKGAVGDAAEHHHSTARPGPDQAPIVPRLLWGWPEILAATGIPRRTLERQIAAGRFVQPVRRTRRRPFWNAEEVRRWAEGGGR